MSAFQSKSSSSSKSSSRGAMQSGGQPKSHGSDSSNKKNSKQDQQTKGNTGASRQVSKFHSSKESRNLTRRETVVTTREVLGQQTERKKLVFGWIQDVSGSMAGGRIKTSLEGFEFMFNQVYDPNDFLGVVTFSEEVKSLHKPMPVKKIDMEKDKANILNNMSGRTACYDAVAASIRDLQIMVQDEKYGKVTQDAVYQLLLVTDGEDNCSSQFNLEQLIELVSRPGVPNFHFFVVAVGMATSEKKNLLKLCNSAHTTFIDVADIGELQKTFHRVAESVQQRLVVTTTTVTETHIVSGNKKASIVKLDNSDGKKLSHHSAPSPYVHMSNRMSVPAPGFARPRVSNNSTMKPHVQKSNSGMSAPAPGSKLPLAGKNNVKMTRPTEVNRNHNNVCFFFSQSGVCRNGNSCKFQHVTNRN